MDFKDIIAWGGSLIIGIGSVAIFLGKFLPHATKYLNIAKEALDIADTAVKALKDGNISKEEVDGIAKEIEELKLALKA